MKMKTNGIEMNYELSGQGECLVLIHGFGDNMGMWYNQTPEFAKRYRVLTYDVRGFGKTEKGEQPYSIELLAEDLCQLLATLEIESACILGFSMGGRIALEFALTYPQMVTGLILSNTGVEAFPKREMEKHREIMKSLLQQGDIEIISKIMTKGSFSRDFSEKNPEAYQRCKEIRMQNDPSEYLAIMEAIDEALDAPIDLGRIQCPVLITTGENDILMGPDVAEYMQKRISAAELKVLPTGHVAPIEAPEDFNRIVLNFIDGLR